MIRSKYQILFLLIFILCSVSICAQQVDRSTSLHNLWISLNVGPVFRSVETNIYGDITLEYSNEKSIYSIQYFGISKFTNIKPANESNNLHNYDGVNIMYGRIHKNTISKFSYSGGLSFLIIPKILHNGEITSENDYSLGVPLSLQFMFAPIKLIGIGIKVNANLNSKSSFIGTSIGLYFGKVSN